ncbi:hypothetical protein STEG23_016015, partial [Scotinomys teguina]
SPYWIYHSPLKNHRVTLGRLGKSFLVQGPEDRGDPGTDRHELTSWKSFPSIFKFFAEASEAKSSSQQPAQTRRSHRIKHEEL